MARIPYVYYRLLKTVETGVLEIEVDDATDFDSIVEKLNNRDFIKCIPMDSETHFEDWKFEPLGNVVGPIKLKAVNDNPEDN